MKHVQTPSIGAHTALRRLAVASAVLLVAAGCTATPTSPPSRLQVSTVPNGLFPAFSPSVTDYVTRCTPGVPTNVIVGVPTPMSASVDGQPARGGTFTVPVTLGFGQGFTIVVDDDDDGTPTADFHVRCLPGDFPLWTSRRTGTTQAEFYITVPTPAGGGKAYPTVFDNNGVPLWWGAPGNASYATLLPNGNMAWTLAGPSLAAPGDGVEERALDGSLVRTISPPEGGTDIHDLLLLPNGNYVIAAATIRRGVDLSMLCVGTACGPASTSVHDQVIEELTPDGTVVWSWSAADNIAPAEMDPQWYAPVVALAGPPYDLYHWNSVEWTGTGFLLSFRYMDAIYNVDRATGDVVWKLGGTPRPQSLVVRDDPVFPTGGFGGQHDARWLGDGTVTLHDNGTGRGRAPRALRYRLDTTTTPATATLVERLDDAAIGGSACGGGARRLQAGNWVLGWGCTNTATEATPDGTRVFSLEFLGLTGVYRMVPVLPGRLDRAALRAGMDAQYAS